MSYIGIFCESDNQEALIKSLFNSKNIHCSFYCSPSASNAFENSNKTNPFILISNSDILVFDVSQPDWYNLAIESIQQSKHVMLLNPYSIRHEQAKYLQLLSKEADTTIQPLLNPKVVALSKIFKKPSYLKISFSANKLNFQNKELEKILPVFCEIVASFVSCKVKKSFTYSSNPINHEPKIFGVYVSFINGFSTHIEIDTTIHDEGAFLVKVCEDEKVCTIDWNKDSIKYYYSRNDKELNEKLEYHSETYLSEAINNALTGLCKYNLSDFLPSLKVFEELKRVAY